MVDGHSSHINLRFIDYCDTNGVLLAILPPHSTHRLQGPSGPTRFIKTQFVKTDYINPLAVWSGSLGNEKLDFMAFLKFGHGQGASDFDPFVLALRGML